MTVSSSITLEVIDLSLESQEATSSSHGEEDVVVQLVTDTVSKCGVFDASKDVSDVSPILSTSRSLLQSFRRFGVNSSTQVEEEKEKVVKSISRFLKVNDRYIALTSLLLKSHLYHTLTEESSSAKESERVERRNKIKRVTTLPKTEKGRPYIPSVDISFSISHQYPFVGMAYMKDKSAERIPAQGHENLLIGLDIVMFTSYRDTQHLYSGVDEFIEVFRDSFSPKEWNEIESIHCPNNEVETNPRLIEFFLRWSVKEAYTKALGLGMSLDFKSFHTQMYQDFEDPIPVTYLWRSFLKSEKPFTFMAKVEYNDKQDDETWQFSFLPLGFEKRNASGAACICLSRKDRQITRPCPYIDITYKSLQELISFHTG